MKKFAENKINSSFIDLLKMGSPKDAEEFATEPQRSSDDAGGEGEVESVNLIDLDDGDKVCDGPTAQSYS